MADVRTALVLLLEEGATAPMSPDRYRSFFLSTLNGVGRYWYKQTNGGIVWEGDVYGWSTPQQVPNWNDPASLFVAAVQVANVDIESEYDVCIVFSARVNNAGTKVGTSSTLQKNVTPQTKLKRLNSYVILDTNSPFDVCAHELGHATNFSHSFSDTETQYVAWRTFGGEYGHPRCVMSAGTYGNVAAAWTPADLPTPHPKVMERIPPSLNGWEAALSGWASAISWSIGDPERTIEMDSLGSWPSSLPKVVRIKGRNGNEYSVEYRSRDDFFDSGQPSAVVINHGTGGRAYRAYGGGATYLGAIELPMHINKWDSVYNSPYDAFAVEVLDWKGSSVVLRLSNGLVKPQLVTTEEATDETVRRESAGSFDFTNAGVHCATGRWDVTRVLSSLSTRLTLRLPDWPSTFAARWWVSGQELATPSGTLSIQTQVESPLPLPKGTMKPRTVQLKFIRKGPNEILLSNDPTEGNFSVSVRCSVAFSVGSFDSTMTVDFRGEMLDYPREFYAALNACLITERDLARPQKTQHIVIPQRDLPRPSLAEPLNQQLLSAIERLDDPFEDAVIRQLFNSVTGTPSQRARVVPAAGGSVSDLLKREGAVDMKPHLHGVSPGDGETPRPREQPR